MHAPSTSARDTDGVAVASQIGRSPRGPWSVATRCGFGHPSVLLTPPSVDGGRPFPTLFWLTCPWLVEAVSRLESQGETREWVARFARDKDVADRMILADERYRSLRAAAGGGEDPCGDVGIAGQRDPLATKCLHAHVAAYLAGLDDPVGESFMAHAEPECCDDRCAKFTANPADL